MNTVLVIIIGTLLAIAVVNAYLNLVVSVFILRIPSLPRHKPYTETFPDKLLPPALRRWFPEKK